MKVSSRFEEQSELKLSPYGAKSGSRQREVDGGSRYQTAGGDQDKQEPVEFFQDGGDMVRRSLYYDADGRV